LTNTAYSECRLTQPWCRQLTNKQNVGSAYNLLIFQLQHMANVSRTNP